MKENSQPIRVVWFEDDDLFQDSGMLYLEDIGIEVVAVAKTIGEALALLDQIDDSEIDAALIDGNLAHGQTDGKHGEQIVREIQGRKLDITTIGLSGDGVDGADHNVLKQHGFEVLVSLLLSLADAEKRE